MCTQEYYPKGSGIANVAYYLTKSLKRAGHHVTILSPYGPDISLGYEQLIAKYGGLGLILFWNKVRSYINNNYTEYDKIIVHNPLFMRKLKYPEKISSIVHTTYIKYYDLYKNQDISIKDKVYYFIMKYIERWCYKRNHFKSSGVSQEVCNELLKLGLNKDRVTYIPNGVDIDEFQPLANKCKFDAGLPIDNKILLSVGRLNNQKQPEKLIETFKYIEWADLPYSLVFVGDGELLDKCKDLVKLYGLKNVGFLGKINHKNLSLIYSAADCYIISSCYEGQPLTLLEAMSCGVPFIVSDIPNLSHFVEDTCTGIKVNFDNPESASEKIIRHLETTDLSLESDIVRKFAVKNLDWDKICLRHFDG